MKDEAKIVCGVVLCMFGMLAVAFAMSPLSYYLQWWADYWRPIFH